MVEKAFNKFCWGFFFTLLSFKVQGFDILPDVVGYILFAMGFSAMASYSKHFQKAKVFNYIMIGVSLLSIYEKPVQSGGTLMGLPFALSISIGIISVILNLIIIYNLFAGIIQMAKQQRITEIADEAEKKWTQYIVIQIAVFALFLFIAIPTFAVIYMICLVVVLIAYTVIAMSFMKKCGTTLKNVE